MRRRVGGLTLVEVLVASAVLAIFAAAVAGLLVSGARLQAVATRTTARTHLLEAHAVPGAAAAEPPRCGAVHKATVPVVCLRARERCRLDGAALRCDGTGPLLRLDLDVEGPAARSSAAPPLRVWGRAP